MTKIRIGVVFGIAIGLHLGANAAVSPAEAGVCVLETSAGDLVVIWSGPIGQSSEGEGHV
jgi:hypothetical protein